MCMDPKTTEPTDALAQAAHARKVSPRADLWQSLAWVILGAATLVESLRMDRLENQDINPYTIPGLLPACLGVAIILLGLLMAYRSLNRGALKPGPASPFTAEVRHELARIWVILALCVGFAVGLVGRGLSFWMAAAAFVTVTILILQREQLALHESRVKGGLKAALIGVGAGLIITLVFQEFFLVRLP
jgi:hypothetical protein